jgi:hypothetical protein
MTKLIVYLSEQEIDALQQSAERDLRDLRGQARYLIIKGLANDLATEAAQPVKLAQPVECGSDGRAA